MPTRLIPIDIPLGRGGQNASPNVDLVPVEDLTESLNLSFEHDTAQKEGGAAIINTGGTLGSNIRVVGLADWVDGSGTQFLIAALHDGRLVTVTANGIGVTLASGLGTNRQTVMVEIINGTSKRLVCFNGNDAPQVTRGTAATTANLATPPTDWSGTNQPTAGCQSRLRLFAWGNANDPHRLYYSTTTNHEDFTGAGSGSLAVFPGEGERIAAGIAFLGRIYLFKYPYGIYWVDEGLTSDATSVWTVRRLTRNVGMAGPLGITLAEGDALFLGTDGLIHALTGVKEFGDARDSAILFEKLSPFLRDHLSLSRLARAVAVYYPFKKEAHFAVSEGGTLNDRRLVLDTHVPGNPKARWSDRDICEAMTTRRASNGIYRLVIGDDNGFVWELDQLVRSKNGLGYEARAATKPIPLLMGGARRANLHLLDLLVATGSGPSRFAVDVELDGKIRPALNYVVSGTTLVLDVGALDTATLGGAPDDTQWVQRRVTGDARFVRLRFRNNQADQNFSVRHARLWVTPGNTRP